MMKPRLPRKRVKAIPLIPCPFIYARIAARRASTSSMTGSGTDSRRLALRATRSRARGWSQRITPPVRMPVSSSDTAKPRRRAKLPPVVIGKTTAALVKSLNDAGDMMTTGRNFRCSWPAEGSKPTSQISPRCTMTVRFRPACHPARRNPLFQTTRFDRLRVDVFTSSVTLAVDPLYPGPGGRFRRRSFDCTVWLAQVVLMPRPLVDGVT